MVAEVQITVDEKTAIGLISKKQFCTAAHFFCTFICRCFARLQRKTSRNFLVTRFMAEMSHVFLFNIFFFHCRSIIFTLVAASTSHFLTATTKFSCFSSNKKILSFAFLSRASSLSLSFSLSFAGLSPTLSLSLSLHGYRNNFRFPFSSLVVSASQDTGGYAISRQKNLELHLGCHTC